MKFSHPGSYMQHKNASQVCPERRFHLVAGEGFEPPTFGL